MMFANWLGLRCRLKLCPHFPTRDGYACAICGSEKKWRALIGKEEGEP